MRRKKKVHYNAPLNIRHLSEQAVGDENYQLSVYYAFDSADLRANIEGNITNFQLARLGEIWWNRFYGLALGLPFTLVFGYVFGGGVVIRELLKENRTWAYFFALAGLYLVAYAVREAWSLVQLVRDVKQHQIYTVTGKAKMGISWFAWGAEVMRVEGVRFVILPKETGCSRLFIKTGPLGRYSYPFQENQWYAIYYLPHSKTIISAEISREEDFNALLLKRVVVMGADGEIAVEQGD